MRKHWHVRMWRIRSSPFRDMVCRTKREAESLALEIANEYRDFTNFKVFGNKRSGYLLKPPPREFPPYYVLPIHVSIDRCEKPECVTH